MYPKSFVEQIHGGKICFQTFQHPSGEFHSDAMIFLEIAGSIVQRQEDADRMYPTAELAEIAIRERTLAGIIS